MADLADPVAAGAVTLLAALRERGIPPSPLNVLAAALDAGHSEAHAVAIAKAVEQHLRGPS